MAGIGQDIKEVLQELTTPFVMTKIDGSTVVGEYLDYEMYFEQSTEFIRQYAYSGTFQYDTLIEQGDLITFDNKNFLMMNVKKTLFENEVVDYSNFFIEANTFGRFSRAGEVRDPSTLKLGIVWAVVQNNVYGTMVVNAPNTEILGSTEVIKDRYTLFVQGFSTIQPGDRWYPDITDLTEYYLVKSIDKYRFTGLLTIKLTEDSRE